MKPFEMAETFHRTFDNNRPQQPTAFSKERVGHRVGFKVEELVELLYASSQAGTTEFEDALEAMHQAIDRARDKMEGKSEVVEDVLVEQVDALTDLLYFTYGSFSLLGVDPQPILEIVHEANMGKIFPDGQPHYHPVTHKVLKPDNWEEDYAPEKKIRAEIERQKNERVVSD
ncbi:HAD family hydrolase [Enterococcus alcedinis]|uniref:Haloacid dehalogenase n=1 Tax=Enterococcus alcedinis TaxID=1274384 RepID=A0A917JJ41_9ENTE|nr:HAD family hydrolase [Enterococcus alcedinis]MBP2103198.1 putative HAD superfamily Cof-like phosphohydrolase [Enterococcus alcedinis]GGI66762.1 haloacid dehalogenase [Enterococcus alcedinis]